MSSVFVPSAETRIAPASGSHAALICTASPKRVRPGPFGQIDAVVVPAARGAMALAAAAHLATRLGATLVALCSQQTSVAEVAGLCAGIPDCRAVVIDVPGGFRHALMPTRTDAVRFRRANAHRTSDLSLKRNLGLLLARLRNWGKILFLDDDIGTAVGGRPVALPDAALRRLVAALDYHQTAGLACHEFPDNSVVCHARRLAGFAQDTFVSGAVTGVNCNDHPVAFFPDQYNEDWFFFARRVAARDLAHVGTATQAAYDPFCSPERARQEEFGDVLAEGLFTLFEDQPDEMGFRYRLDAANERYWERYIATRHGMIGLTAMSIEVAAGDGQPERDRMSAALRSLDVASAQLDTLTPELCVDYLAAWADDLVEWERVTQRIRGVGSTAEALDFLGLRDWCPVGAATASCA